MKQIGKLDIAKWVAWATVGWFVLHAIEAIAPLVLGHFLALAEVIDVALNELQEIILEWMREFKNGG